MRSAHISCWHPGPRSPRRPIPSPPHRLSSTPSARPGTPVSRWACSPRPRTCWQPWIACTRRDGRWRRRGRLARPDWGTSTWTSSTAPPVRPTTTCAGPSPPCSRPGLITCRHMRWWSRRALPWRGACAAVSCPIPTRTRWPTVTSCWMPRSPRPGWTGTRSPTGRGPAGNAVTTSVTGRVVTGGAPVRGPMGTSTGCGGGTSSTPTPMPDGY
ncbi:Uncharacterised protein [Mycobacteroides abscessus subsp. abscessus]|nr:Uncharacterised protein [Mycobacteroides abscessus subsp. abscessus]